MRATKATKESPAERAAREAEMAAAMAAEAQRAARAIEGAAERFRAEFQAAYEAACVYYASRPPLMVSLAGLQRLRTHLGEKYPRTLLRAEFACASTITEARVAVQLAPARLPPSVEKVLSALSNYRTVETLHKDLGPVSALVHAPESVAAAAEVLVTVCNEFGKHEEETRRIRDVLIGSAQNPAAMAVSRWGPE